MRLPYFNGKDNTWFEAYWEGFRSAQSLSYFASVPTAAMRGGDFSGILGPPNRNRQSWSSNLAKSDFRSEYDARPDPRIAR